LEGLLLLRLSGVIVPKSQNPSLP